MNHWKFEQNPATNKDVLKSFWIQQTLAIYIHNGTCEQLEIHSFPKLFLYLPRTGRTYCIKLWSTVEPRYNEDLGTRHENYLVISGFSLHQGKKKGNIKSWDQQNHLVILEGFVISDLFIMRFHSIWFLKLLAHLYFLLYTCINGFNPLSFVWNHSDQIIVYYSLVSDYNSCIFLYPVFASSQLSIK